MTKPKPARTTGADEPFEFNERDRVAMVLRDAREARGLTLRAVQAATALLEEEDPDLYQTVHYMSARKYELLGHIEGSQNVLYAESRRTRAIIRLYFGSVRHFIAITGVDPHISPVGGEEAQPITRVPLYVQGSFVDPQDIGQGVNAARTVVLPAPVGDFALEIAGMTMSPAMHEGQVVFCRFTQQVKVGRLMVLYRERQVSLAYCIATRDGGVFATLEHGKPSFTLDEHEYVFGWVTLADPNVPSSQLGVPDDVAHSA